MSLLEHGGLTPTKTIYIGGLVILLNLGGLIATSMFDQGDSVRKFAQHADIAPSLLSNAIGYRFPVRIPPAALPRIAEASGFSLTMLAEAAENEAIANKAITSAAQEHLCAEIARLHLVPEGDSKCRLAGTDESSRHFGRWLNHVWGARLRRRFVSLPGDWWHDEPTILIDAPIDKVVSELRSRRAPALLPFIKEIAWENSVTRLTLLPATEGDPEVQIALPRA